MNIAVTLVVLAVTPPLNESQPPVVSPPPGWCATRAAGQGPAASGGVCAPEGECDVPAVRDAFAVDPGTLFVTIRAHMLVFRETDGSNPAATPEQVAAQLDRLNEGFEPYRFRFQLTWEYIDDSTYRVIPSFGSPLTDQMKQTYAVSPATQCNIFVIGHPTNFGTFPWDPAALTPTGGIVMSDAWFSPDHLVIIHEMGHTLGLWHTHHGVDEASFCRDPCYERADGLNGDTTGDFCSDTPPTPANFGLCDWAPGNDPCSGVPWAPTQPENYMSYGTDTGTDCWTLFTTQQAARTHCWTQAVLAGWAACGSGADCNGNLIDDDCDISEGTSLDQDGDGVPDECSCPADLDGDGVVGTTDFLSLLGAWGSNPGGPPDLDGDGDVDTVDFLALLGSWGPC